MTKNKGVPRKTKKIVRTPATRLAHLRKRMRRRPDHGPGKSKKS